jgi:hypothetical protein
MGLCTTTFNTYAESECVKDLIRSHGLTYHTFFVTKYRIKPTEHCIHTVTNNANTLPSYQGLNISDIRYTIKLLAT